MIRRTVSSRVPQADIRAPVSSALTVLNFVSQWPRERVACDSSRVPQVDVRASVSSAPSLSSTLCLRDLQSESLVIRARIPRLRTLAQLNAQVEVSSEPIECRYRRWTQLTPANCDLLITLEPSTLLACEGFAAPHRHLQRAPLIHTQVCGSLIVSSFTFQMGVNCVNSSNRFLINWPNNHNKGKQG